MDLWGIKGCFRTADNEKMGDKSLPYYNSTRSNGHLK